MRGCSPVSALFLAIFSLAAAQSSLDGLVSNSPFAATNAAGANNSADTVLEFRSVLVDRGETFFSLYDPASRSSMWVGLREPGNPFTVQAYDETKGIATVEHNGRTLSLPLKQAKVAAAPAAPVAGAQPLPSPSGQQNVAPAQAAATDAERLASVAAEIRRRRALRAQNTQTTQPSPPPTQGTPK